MKLLILMKGACVVLLCACLTSASLAASPTTMAAMRLGADGKLAAVTVDVPKPGKDEMLVRVHSAGVNPVDWKMHRGGDFTPGFDVSGVVETVGDDVHDFKVGDAIFAYLSLQRGGGYAEYAIVKPSEAAIKPSKATFAQAAATPLAGLTAWQALFDTADLKDGQSVLIHAAAGGVGTFAVQLARWKHACVSATASLENHEFLKSIGAELLVDYRTQRFETFFKDEDVVLDPIGGDTQERSWQTLRKGGILVALLGKPPAERAEHFGVRGAGILVHPDAKELAQLGKLIDDGSVTPIVEHTFPLADANKAWEQSQTGHTRGKIVLKLIDD